MKVTGCGLQDFGVIFVNPQIFLSSSMSLDM